MKTIFLGLVAFALYGGDIAAVKAEPRLERRSELAVQNADRAFLEAKAAWKKGETGALQTALDEIEASVNLCLDALHEMGRPPYKLVRWYKSAELKTRELSRSLDGLAVEASLEERPAIQKVNDRVKTVHEELLLGVLSRKK